ncbi:MAG: hypothetical protein RL536_638, partial [Candidatus Parcubacteria bacterium]
MASSLLGRKVLTFVKVFILCLIIIASVVVIFLQKSILPGSSSQRAQVISTELELCDPNNTPNGTPLFVTALSVVSTTQNSVTISWNGDLITNEDGFLVERAPVSSNSFQPVGRTAVDTTSFTDSALIPSTTYTYRVRAFNCVGFSAPLSTINATTLVGTNPPISPTVTIPATPTIIFAKGVSSSEVDIGWRDNSNNEDGFIIERSLDQSLWSEISRTASGQNTFADKNVSPGTDYYYRIRSFNTAGNSVSSTAKRATTKGTVVIDDTPPTVTIVSPARDATITKNSPPFNFQVDATDDKGIAKIDLYINGSPVLSKINENTRVGSYSIPIRLSINGIYKFSASVTDNKGHTTTVDPTITVVDSQIRNGTVYYIFLGTPGYYYDVMRSENLGFNWEKKATIQALPDGSIPYNEPVDNRTNVTFIFKIIPGTAPVAPTITNFSASP